MEIKIGETEREKKASAKRQQRFSCTLGDCEFKRSAETQVKRKKALAGNETAMI